jgi:hypothetical protein
MCLLFAEVERLVDAFPGQSIDFFGALRARVYDDKVSGCLQSCTDAGCPAGNVHDLDRLFQLWLSRHASLHLKAATALLQLQLLWRDA